MNIARMNDSEVTNKASAKQLHQGQRFSCMCIVNSECKTDDHDNNNYCLLKFL